MYRLPVPAGLYLPEPYNPSPVEDFDLISNLYSAGGGLLWYARPQALSCASMVLCAPLALWVAKASTLALVFVSTFEAEARGAGCRLRGRRAHCALRPDATPAFMHGTRCGSDLCSARAGTARRRELVAVSRATARLNGTKPYSPCALCVCAFGPLSGNSISRATEASVQRAPRWCSMHEPCAIQQQRHGGGGCVSLFHRGLRGRRPQASTS